MRRLFLSLVTFCTLAGFVGAQLTITPSGGGNVDLSSPPPIGANTPNTGAFTTLSTTGDITKTTAGNLGINLQGSAYLFVGGNGLVAGSVFSATLTTTNSPMLIAPGAINNGITLSPSGTGAVEIRNGTNAQLFNIYKTYTDASNYERLQIGFNGSEFQITSQKGGTGVSRDLFLKSVGNLYFSAGGGNAQWKVDSANGDLLAITHNTRDIGSSSNAPRDIYAGRTVNAALNLSAGNGVYATNLNAGFDAPASGVVRLLNAAGTDFNRLQFGGMTASFPAQKRNGATLEDRLADDSGFAARQSLYDRFGAGTPEGNVAAPVGAVYHRTDGGAGTAFYVKESGNTTANGWVAK